MASCCAQDLLHPLQHLLHVYQLAGHRLGQAVSQIQQDRVAEYPPVVAAVVQLQEAVDDRFGGLGELQVVFFAQLGRADAQAVFVAIQGQP